MPPTASSGKKKHHHQAQLAALLIFTSIQLGSFDSTFSRAHAPEPTHYLGRFWYSGDVSFETVLDVIFASLLAHFNSGFCKRRNRRTQLAALSWRGDACTRADMKSIPTRARVRDTSRYFTSERAPMPISIRFLQCLS